MPNRELAQGMNQPHSVTRGGHDGRTSHLTVARIAILNAIVNDSNMFERDNERGKAAAMRVEGATLAKAWGINPKSINGLMR